MTGDTILNIAQGVIYLFTAVMVGAAMHAGDGLYYLLAGILTVTALAFSLTIFVARRDPEGLAEAQRYYREHGPQQPLM